MRSLRLESVRGLSRCPRLLDLAFLGCCDRQRPSQRARGEISDGSGCQQTHPYSAALQNSARPIVAVAWDNGISHVGAAGLTLTTTLKLADIKTLAAKALRLFESDAYKKTAFSVVDEFKPVRSRDKVELLNSMLVDNLRLSKSRFELCLPQLTFDDYGYVEFYGVGLQEEFPDISLELYNSTYDDIEVLTLDSLGGDTIRLFNDEHDNVGNWSVYKCLIGGLEDSKGLRYVLNEGSWHVPSSNIIGPVEKYFSDRGTCKIERGSRSDSYSYCIRFRFDSRKKGFCKRLGSKSGT
jgi:uncharacterized protein (TIGR04141 family)